MLRILFILAVLFESATFILFILVILVVLGGFRFSVFSI
jgi:hypothetical protein